MPCFSAHNVRLFTGQQDQQHRKSAGEQHRPRTSVAQNDVPEMSKTIRLKCESWFHAHGYDSYGHSTQKGPKSKWREQKSSELQKPTLSSKELERLKNASKVVTLADKLEAVRKQQDESNRLEKEADIVRQRFKEIDDARKQAAEEKVKKEDLFGAGEKVKVLERAFVAKHEQEEEVKRVNRIILNAKCHAVRDAQIQEKREIEKELRNDELRLDKKLLEAAIKELNDEDSKFERQNEDKMKYASEIRKQLTERERLRFLEAERIEEEAKMLRKANEAIKRDEEREAQLKRECRAKFRNELNKIAEMSAFFKKMLCEQEREAEMRVAAYQREKEMREQALKNEQKLAKEELERKQQRLYMLAQKTLESKSQRDDMDYLRAREQIERTHRHKEKEAILRQQQLEKKLKEARECQLQEMKHRQALQIARAEQDFNNLTESIKLEEVKMKQQEAERKCQRKRYRSDIIKQMNDKELERRRLLEWEKNQAFAWRENDRQRDANIRAVINAKLAAMRDACLPEKYIKDVEKHLIKIASK